MSAIKVNYVRESYEKYMNNNEHYCTLDIKTFMRSPKAFIASPNNCPNKFFPLLGAAMLMLFNPEEFPNQYSLAPSLKLSTTEGKEANKKFLEELKGRTALREVDYSMIVEAAAMISEKPDLYKSLESSEMELSCYWSDPKTGIKLKTRPSAINKSTSVIYDTKFTSRWPNALSFNTECATYDYTMGAAIAQNVLKMDTYVCVYIKEGPPFNVCFFKFTEDQIKEANEKFDATLELMKWCFDHNIYPDVAEFEMVKSYQQMGMLNIAYEAISNGNVLINHI